MQADEGMSHSTPTGLNSLVYLPLGAVQKVHQLLLGLVQHLLSHIHYKQKHNVILSDD